jgi:hypothetical protein
MRTEFWLGSLKRRDNSEDLGLDGMILLKWIFPEKYGFRMWIGFIWLRIRICGGLL